MFSDFGIFDEQNYVFLKQIIYSFTSTNLNIIYYNFYTKFLKSIYMQK